MESVLTRSYNPACSSWEAFAKKVSNPDGAAMSGAKATKHLLAINFSTSLSSTDKRTRYVKSSMRQSANLSVGNMKSEPPLSNDLLLTLVVDFEHGLANRALLVGVDVPAPVYLVLCQFGANLLA